MIKIALTGNIASGKSLAQAHLESLGVPSIDADKICHEALDIPKVADEVSKIFMPISVLDENNLISRKKIAEIIFSNKDKKLALEKILHKITKQEIELFFKQHKDAKLAVAAIPLLFEAGWQDSFDKIILITSNFSTRLERLKNRNNFTEAQALARMNAQMPEEEKLPLADIVVDNNSTIEDFKAKLDLALRPYLYKS